jgi:hypothetical protein
MVYKGIYILFTHAQAYFYSLNTIVCLRVYSIHLLLMQNRKKIIILVLFHVKNLATAPYLLQSLQI